MDDERVPRPGSGVDSRLSAGPAADGRACRMACGCRARPPTQRLRSTPWPRSSTAAAAITHLTAARMRNWWTVHRCLAGYRSSPPRTPATVRAVAELRIIRTTPWPGSSASADFPSVGAVDVLLAVARHLSLVDVVVVLDSALHLGDVTPDSLAVALLARRFGVRRLRTAFVLADGAPSRRTRPSWRLLHHACEVTVRPQHEVRVDGRLVARGDLRIMRAPGLSRVRRRGPPRPRAGTEPTCAAIATSSRSRWVRRGYTDLEVLRRPVTILRDADRTLGRVHDASGRTRGTPCCANPVSPRPVAAPAPAPRADRAGVTSRLQTPWPTTGPEEGMLVRSVGQKVCTATRREPRRDPQAAEGVRSEGPDLHPVHERWISPVSAPGWGNCRQTNGQIPDGERVNPRVRRLSRLHICGITNAQVTGVLRVRGGSLSTRCPPVRPQAGACRPRAHPSYPQGLWRSVCSWTPPGA